MAEPVQMLLSMFQCSILLVDLLSVLAITWIYSTISYIWFPPFFKKKTYAHTFLHENIKVEPVVLLKHKPCGLQHNINMTKDRISFMETWEQGHAWSASISDLGGHWISLHESSLLRWGADLTWSGLSGFPDFICKSFPLICREKQDKCESQVQF